ncbi:MAG: dihydroorotate dehydrogenase electron transfer subunit [Candidatus Anoxymicrobium japonicum]|uniref:Dihydroorotate dehydrogenase electron transfer subunit n=1 Tax=Candidatus Anoxymicrobium japonicum TaxID=2013648 RepID=A0A2N3G7M5_9ACTN|nr:MAG: dihydroorotate dehydrogenase electron transfer subunit [Candidatus Anoxymicrobium japonicum]
MSEASTTAPVSSIAVVTARNEVARDVHVLTLEITSGARAPLPGQFYQIDCGGGREHLLPRPIGAMDARVSRGGVALAFMVESVGWGTGRLCRLVPGDEIRVLGPLGRGFGPISGGTALIVAGGMGFAPLCFLASKMDRDGERYDLLAGVNSKEKYMPALATLNGVVEVFSDDGTIGRKGIVTDGVASRLDEGGYTKVYTCGPEPMMESVARVALTRGVPCEVSLDSRMACGIGACRGCVREGSHGRNLCVCADGPVFDSRDVKWNVTTKFDQ